MKQISPRSALAPSSSIRPETQGYCLFYDSVLKEWVKSGKVVLLHGYFRAILENHSKPSELKNCEDRQSNFHALHPTGRLGSQGKHEFLQPHCTF